jgi:predicted RNase H-like HicB family nuclease
MAELTFIKINGEILIVDPPVKLDLSNVNDYYYAKNDSLEVYGYGNTEEDAIESAREIFGEMYKVALKIVRSVKEP